MDEINDNIKKMYLRINGEIIDHEMPPPHQKKLKLLLLMRIRLKNWRSGKNTSRQYTVSTVIMNIGFLQVELVK